MKNYALRATTLILLAFIVISCSAKTIIKTDNKYKELVEINRVYEKKINSTYKHLIANYSLNHYGVYTHELIAPKIIVIHATASMTIKPVIETFKSDILMGIDYAKAGGSVNLGSHFVIERDGTIYSIIPLDTMARHTIGFNYTAIGIENVGYPNDITEKQLIANTKLIKYLKQKFDTIEHVIGHHEFNKKYLPHYYLAKQLDSKYKLLNKIDPGEIFMSTLREELSK